MLTASRCQRLSCMYINVSMTHQSKAKQSKASSSKEVYRNLEMKASGAVTISISW